MANDVVEKKGKFWIANDAGERISKKMRYEDFYTILEKRGSFLLYYFRNKYHLLNIDTKEEIFTFKLPRVNHWYPDYRCNIYVFGGNTLIFRDYHNICKLITKDGDVLEEDITNYHDFGNCILIKIGNLYKIYSKKGELLKDNVKDYYNVSKEQLLIEHDQKLVLVDRNLKVIRSMDLSEDCVIDYHGYDVFSIKNSSKIQLFSLSTFDSIIEFEGVNCIRDITNTQVLLIEKKDGSTVVFDCITKSTFKTGKIENKIVIKDFVIMMDYEYTYFYNYKKGTYFTTQKFSNVILSEDKKYFIIKNGELYGVFSFDGKELIPPYQNKIYETPTGFYYTEEKFTEVLKEVNK